MASMADLMPNGAAPPPRPVGWDYLNEAYRTSTGRDMTDADYAGQTGGGRYTAQKNLDWAKSQIAGSQEARNYAAAQAKAKADADAKAKAEADAKAKADADAAARAKGEYVPSGTGGTGSSKYTYTGFDFNQDAKNRDTGKSAKYAFAEATRQAAESGVGDIWKTKAGAQMFAEQYVKPKLEAAGFKVLEIVGDKMRVVTREDMEAGNTAGSWIDFVVNADGDSPALAWQAEATREAFGTLDPYVPTPTAPTAPATTPPTNTTPGNEHGPVAPETGINPYAYESLIPSMADIFPAY